MKKGFERLTKRELSLLDKNVNGKHIVSFYSSDGAILKNLIPTCLQLKLFKNMHQVIYALDGTMVKRLPSGGEKMYSYLEKHCISSNMRQAIMEETMKLNDSVKKKVFERDGLKCALCGSTNKLCIDHIFPVSRGGFTTLNNLQVLCERCNIQKGNMTMEEFNKWKNRDGTNKNDQA